jgi:hypothetical protein
MTKGVWLVHLRERGFLILPCKELDEGEIELGTIRAFEGFVDGPNRDDGGK